MPLGLKSLEPEKQIGKKLMQKKTKNLDLNTVRGKLSLKSDFSNDSEGNIDPVVSSYLSQH